MAFPALPAHEHQRRLTAVLTALAEGCAPPNVSTKGTRGVPRAINRATELLRLDDPTFNRGRMETWLLNHPFPWPDAIGEKPKLTTAYLDRMGLRPVQQIATPPVVDGLPEVTPQATLDALMERRLKSKISEIERRMKEAETRAIEAEDALRLAHDLDAVNLNPPTWAMSPDVQHGQPGVPCLSLNDWHLGEVVRPKELDGINEYNLDIAAGRIQRVVQRTLDLCFEHTRGPGGVRPEYPGIVVFANGDMVSGDIHEELRETNEVSRNASVLMAAEHLTAAVTIFADYFGRVHVCCSPGNHGRDGKPRAKLICATNADWLTYKLCERYTAKDPRITWDIPESGDFRVEVAGLRIMGTHCDRLGVKGGDGLIGSLGPVARGELKLGRMQAVLGRHYDMLVGAHFHQTLMLPRVNISNCVIGANEYSISILRAPPSPPSQALFTVHPDWGITSRWEVFAGEKSRQNFGETPCLA